MRGATAASLGAASAALVVSLLVPGWWRLDGWVLVGGLIMGLPHGAMDHLVPRLRLSSPPGWWRTSLFGVVYAAVAAVAWLLFRAFPETGTCVFIALAVLHFAAGEGTFAALRAGVASHNALRGAVAATAAVVVTLLPVTLHWRQVQHYLVALIPTVQVQLPEPALHLTTTTLLICAGAAAASAAIHRLWPEALELCVLTALAVAAPPAVSFGVYFGAWHSVRHLAVLVEEDPQNASALASGRTRGPLARLARDVAGPTAVAALVVVALWQWSANGDLQHFVAADLAVLAGLTVPHAIVVWWLDHSRTHPDLGARSSPSARVADC